MQEETEDMCAIDDFDSTYVPVEILACNEPRTRQTDPQSIVELGKQLLHSAKIGDTDMVKDLMCRGAPFTTDWLGTSALHFAAQNNHLETAEVLLRAGISRDAGTKVDRTPLHMAAYEGHQEMVQLLLNYGAEVDSRDMLKMTPLHWAVEQEHPAVMLTLLEHGADPTTISKFNRTPITLALEHNRPDFLELLQQEREVVCVPLHPLDSHGQSSEFEPDAQNLIKLEAERQEEEQQQIKLEKLQEKQKAKQSTANVNKKQKMIYQRIVPPVEVEHEPVKLQRLQDKSIHLENNKQKEFINLSEIEHPLKFLQAHGLTMIPIDNDTTIVENAMESGQTVVLTEAGKLALNLTKTKPINITPIKRLQVNNKKKASKKVITIRADQLLHQNQPTTTSRGPNILKRSSNDNKNVGKIYITPITNTKTATSTSTKTSTTETRNKVTLKTEPILLHIEDSMEELFEDSNDREHITDIVELNRKLAEAQREADEYRRKLKKKEEEAELYKQQLKTLVAQAHRMK